MKIILFCLSLISFNAIADLKVENAWVKNAPPVVPVRAAYLSLINDTDKKVIINKITSPQFRSVEPHATVLKNGLYSMHALHNLYIPPNSSLHLKPNGKHLMLMMPRQSLATLTHIEINLHIRKGQTITINAPIKN